MSLIKDYLHTKMMDQLEMLSAREQLMEDIDAIVDEFTFDLPIDDIHERSQLAEDLSRILCDAVCQNFPTKWSWPRTKSSTVMNSKQV